MVSEYSIDHFPCGVCGSRRFVMGTARDGSLKAIWFEADGRSLSDKLKGRGKSAVSARMCTRCRHVEMFAMEGDFDGSRLR